jgi:hypothetical protein
MNRPPTPLIRALRRTLEAGLTLPLACACLGFALFVVDYPQVDAMRAAHVKKARMPHHPGVFRDEGFSRWRTNSYGLIGVEPASPGASGVYRVAVFGDSFVEALQVPPTESLTGSLQRMLPPPAGYLRVEVWNFGISGDNTGNAFARWVHRPATIPFDLAIFTFNADDVFENEPAGAQAPHGAFLVADGRGGFELDESHIDARPIPADELWLKRHFGRLVYSAYRLRLRVQEHMADKIASARAALVAWSRSAGTVELGSQAPTVRVDERDRMIADTCAQLLHVRSAIAATGTAALLMALPDAETVQRSDSSPVYSALTSCLRRHTTSLVDPLPALERSLRHGLDPYRDWNEPAGHLNRHGHRIAAREVVTFLGARASLARGLR